MRPTTLIFITFLCTSCSSVRQHQEKAAWWLVDGPVTLQLEDVLKSEPVHIALVATVETAYSRQEYLASGLDIDQWKHTVREDLIARTENTLLSRFAHNPNFHLIDRNATDNLLNEVRLESSGVISENLRIRLGQVLGANFILFSECSRNPGPTSSHPHTDTVTTRLIEAETGTVLASQSTAR